MLLGMSCIGIVDGIAKFLAQGLSGVQVAWGYFLATLACLVVYAWVMRTPPRVMLRAHGLSLQTFRAVCLVMSLSCLFASLRYLPLAEATTISFTAPLFIVALSGPLLSERVGVGRWAAVGAGMLGALIVVRPGSELFHWAALLPLVGAIFFAQFHIVTKRLSAVDLPVTTLFYTFGVGTLIMSLAMPFVWLHPEPVEWLMFAASGALGLVAHLSIVRALKLADASMVAPLNYVRLVWAIGIGYWFFGHVPDAAMVVGGCIIVASGLYVVYAQG